ncbi:transcriptional regulator [Brevibacillus reuszeri]|uniref:Transcriptional regulator n=1 Tax=Brevibacillus reuszeri TaxID=54915 RepID=A0A0K9YYR1_9BACL|nr:TrmB family transcriptional regulator [Brevibacillus reuszeri]KNB73806.1 TrmB family transcriptional regulator [Brevibacillus reuszeri]MED1860051.1 helix-turn-helix domain-containing protein [Brevibacillus reuszeri]GED71128.1 transcriptional regulator [Brevibacillus reuszeri]
MLQSFGFSLYESKVYEALASSAEPLDAAMVVKHSGVPKAKIYEVLNRLVEKGMVLDTISEKKKRYTALPLASLVEKLTQQFQADVKQLTSSLSPKTVRDDRVWSLKVAESIRAECKQLIQGATCSIRISAWEDEFHEFLPLLEEKERSGVEIEALIIGENRTQLSRVHSFVPAQGHEGLERVLLIVVDQDELIFAGEEQNGWQAIKTRAQPFVKFFADSFYHDVALTRITQKHFDLLFGDEEIRSMLIRLRY